MVKFILAILATHSHLSEIPHFFLNFSNSCAKSQSGNGVHFRHLFLRRNFGRRLKWRKFICQKMVARGFSHFFGFSKFMLVHCINFAGFVQIWSVTRRAVFCWSSASPFLLAASSSVMPPRPSVGVSASLCGVVNVLRLVKQFFFLLQKEASVRALCRNCARLSSLVGC